jgi:hypothetical protein
MSYDPMPDRDERTWAMLAHVLAAAGHFVAVLAWLAPLVVWLVKKEQSRFAAFHGLQSLLFQLMWMVILAVGWGITTLLMAVLIGFLLVPVMIALHLVPVIWAVVAGIKASNGEWYEYPVVGAWARRNAAPGSA